MNRLYEMVRLLPVCHPDGTGRHIEELGKEVGNQSKRWQKSSSGRRYEQKNEEDEKRVRLC